MIELLSRLPGMATSFDFLGDDRLGVPEAARLEIRQHNGEYILMTVYIALSHRPGAFSPQVLHKLFVAVLNVLRRLGVSGSCA